MIIYEDKIREGIIDIAGRETPQNAYTAFAVTGTYIGGEKAFESFYEQFHDDVGKDGQMRLSECEKDSAMAFIGKLPKGLQGTLGHGRISVRKLEDRVDEAQTSEKV